MSDNTDWPTGEEDEEEIRRETAPPKVETSATGVQTVKASDIIKSEAGQEGLVKSEVLFARIQESEADEDIAAGRVERFDSMEDAIRALWSEGINDAGEIIECIEDFRQQEKEDGTRQRD